MTKFELQKALEYINKILESHYKVQDFFRYDTYEVPDAHSLKEAMRKKFTENLKSKVEEQIKTSSYFINSFRTKLHDRINEAKDITAVLNHFSKLELTEMESKGFPVVAAWRAYPLYKDDPNTQKFLKYLVEKVDDHIKKDPLSFYMRYYENMSLIEFLNHKTWGFDEIKIMEMELLDTVDRKEVEGLIFGNHPQIKNHLDLSLLSGSTILLNKDDARISEHFESKTLLSFFNDTIVNLNLMIDDSKEKLFRKRYKNKEWLENYIRCLELDQFYAAVAINNLEDFENEFIKEYKFISYKKGDVVDKK